MGLLTFIWKTAKPLYFAFLVLCYGLGAAIASHDPTNIVPALAFMLVVMTPSLVLSQQHMDKLKMDKLARLIEWSFRNNERHGHRTPTEAEGAAYVAAVKEDPINAEWAHTGSDTHP